MADDNKRYPITGKLFYHITLHLQSPVIIGSGEDEHSDVDVLRDPISEKPLIPATSLVGVLRAFSEEFIPAFDHKQLNYLFGDRNTNIAQSALQCKDIELKNHNIVIRDGVKIDYKTNTAVDKNKFNYEVVEGQNTFDLKLEISLRKRFDKDKEAFKKLILTLIQQINAGHIRLGAKTNKGFGRLEVKNVQIVELDFKDNKNHVWRWLSGKYKYEDITEWKTAKTYEVIYKPFVIDAWFKIKNSILVSSYPVDPIEPDAVPIRQNGKYVLPGTSIMGAVRHRAHRIMKTLNVKNWEEKEKHLFGFVLDQNEKMESSETKVPSPTSTSAKAEQARKGRVTIEESIIPAPQAKVQTRIKIDRFTGGTIAGALFEQMALWQGKHDKTIKMKITLNQENSKDNDWEAGLLLLVLKDLWSGDLPIGGGKNIGRGVLQGMGAKITKWDGTEVELKADLEGRIISQDKLDELQIFVDKFWEECENGKK